MILIPYSYQPFSLGYPVGGAIPDYIKYINLAAPIINELVIGKDVNLWCRGSSGASKGIYC